MIFHYQQVNIYIFKKKSFMEKVPTLEVLIEKILAHALAFLPKFVIAIFTLLIGFWLANRISCWFRNILERRRASSNIVPFLTSLVSILIKVLVLISVATKFGIATTSFVALLGGAGLAIGLALQGNLSNFASGVMILIFKPFKIGDNVIISSHTGVVQEILIFNTVLKTADNRSVIIPNNSITSTAITNISGNGELRTELNFKVSGKESIEKVKALILEVCLRNNLIFSDPAPNVAVNTEDLAVTIFRVRVWSKSVNTGKITDFLNEEIKKTFDNNNIQPATAAA